MELSDDETNIKSKTGGYLWIVVLGFAVGT